MASTASLTPPDKLEGWSCMALDDQARSRVIDWALDYRGDVTFRLHGGKEIVGYLFNRSVGPKPTAEMLLAGKDEPIVFSMNEIEGVLFSGRDAAAGKSWEAWLSKVADAESRGEIAELYPEQAA